MTISFRISPRSSLKARRSSGLFAAGILIRAVAPLLAQKRAEPPVVAVAEDGSSAVPLLGGHRGANALAREIATLAGGQAAITTASDLVLGLAFDESPPGWRAADPERLKDLAAALIAGEPVAIDVEAGDADWLRAARLALSHDAPQRIRITDRAPSSGERAFVLHPPVLALGVGCARDCPPDELRGLAEQSLAAARACRGRGGIRRLARSQDGRAGGARSRRRARRAGAVFFGSISPRRDAAPPESVGRGVPRGRMLWRRRGRGARRALDRTARSSCRSRSRRTRPAPSRAPSLRSIREKSAARAAACASSASGRARGCGAPRKPRRPSGRRATSSDCSSISIFWGRRSAANRSMRARSATRAGRAKRALDLAAEGRAVALVSSGDAGIYGLASLVFELLDRERRADWARIDIEVVPGLSALQAAAAQARRAVRARFLRHFALGFADAVAGDRAPPRRRGRGRLRGGAL